MHTRAEKSKFNRKPARQVSELVDKILEPVLARRSGMNMDLIGAWSELVGEQYCEVTRPQKIKWPRKAHEDDPFQPGDLLVACEPHHALFFQHELTSIIERVNVFFGFAAIKSIKIQQKQIANLRQKSKPEKPPLSAQARLRLDKILDNIEDEKLRDKLAKLGQGVYAKNDSR